MLRRRTFDADTAVIRGPTKPNKTSLSEAESYHVGSSVRVKSIAVVKIESNTFPEPRPRKLFLQPPCLTRDPHLHRDICHRLVPEHSLPIAVLSQICQLNLNLCLIRPTAPAEFNISISPHHNLSRLQATPLRCFTPPSTWVSNHTWTFQVHRDRSTDGRH